MADNSLSSYVSSRRTSRSNASPQQPRCLPILAAKRSSDVGLPGAHEVIHEDFWKSSPQNPANNPYNPGLGPPLWAGPVEEQTLYLDDKPLRQYAINGRPYTMIKQEHEDVSYYRRKTVGNKLLEYRLEVVQQPEQARACGAGSKSSSDRRPVDPPPVVRLNVKDKTNDEEGEGVDITFEYEATFMLYASLETERPIAYGRMQVPPAVAALTGVAVASAAYLERPVLGGYFIFPDLSIRHEGFYRLRFHLFEGIKRAEDADLDRPFPDPASFEPSTKPMAPLAHQAMANRMEVVSKPFQVYSAKKFPGLKMSTHCSKVIAEQGCRVRIRRDIRQRKRTNGKGGPADDDRASQHGTPRQQSIEIDPRSRAGSIDSIMHPQDHLRRYSIESQHGRPAPIMRHESYSSASGRHDIIGTPQPRALPSMMLPPQFPSQLVPQRPLDVVPGPSAYVPVVNSSAHRMSMANVLDVPNVPVQLAPIEQPPSEQPPPKEQLPPMEPPHLMQQPPLLAQPTPMRQLPHFERPSLTNTGNRRNPMTGQYDLPPPAASKRSASQGFSDSESLKSGTRPDTVAPAGWRDQPLAGYGRDAPIEADDDAADPQDDFETENIMSASSTGRFSYRRANGGTGLAQAHQDFRSK